MGAVITTSNTQQLSMSQIRTFLATAGGPAPGTTNLSLSTLELRYMGNSPGTGAVTSVAKVCFWQQREIFNRGNVAPGGSSDPTGYTAGKNSVKKPWDYYPGNTSWRPSRISEFQRTYYDPPVGSGTGVATGATNSTGIIRLTFGKGSPSVGIGSLYYFWLDPVGTYGVGTPGAWYSTSATTYDFACASNAGLVGYVVDDKFCGGQMTGSEILITGNCHYP